MTITVKTQDIARVGPLNSIIISYLRQHPQATVFDMTNDLNIGETTARERLRDLESNGYVKLIWGLNKYKRKKFIGVELLC